MMKYCVWLTFLIAASDVIPARAQTLLTFRSGISIARGRSDYSRQISGGWVAGFNSRSITKPYAGISAQFRLSKELFLEPEISYTVMAFKEISHNALLHEARYVTLPVSVRYQANKVLGVFAGPYLGYRLRPSDYPPDLLGTWDAGFQVGGEVKIFRNFGLGSRFYNGLLNIYKDLYDEYPDIYGGDFKLYNRCLQLYVSYSLDLKKEKDR